MISIIKDFNFLQNIYVYLVIKVNLFIFEFNLSCLHYIRSNNNLNNSLNVFM